MTIKLSRIISIAGMLSMTFCLNAVAADNSATSFNRLLKAPAADNLAPAEDGIHDAENTGTSILQTPAEGLAGLPESKHGNRVNWVAAVEDGKINPRWDKLDDSQSPMVMDLNVVREVKGSMPDVVYPHKQHTEWLDCSNCHPAIFIPARGANQIDMASILRGEKCGVCHGTVAFPITATTCRLCHSKDKRNVKLKRSDSSK